MCSLHRANTSLRSAPVHDLLDHLLGFGRACAWGFGLALVMSSKAATAEVPAPWRLDCTGQTDAIACATAAAAAFTQQHPGIAQRTPEHLVIALDNKRIKLIADVEARLDVVALNAVARFVTVRERLTQGYRWHVVSLISGSLTKVDGFPVFSPDGGHFFAVQPLTDDESIPVISRIFAAKHPIPEMVWRAKCEDDALWGLQDPFWKSDTNLTFTQTRLEHPERPEGAPKGQVALHKNGKTWTASGQECILPKKR
jgi:hypothetical protein